MTQTVLIIDDEPSNRYLLRQILEYGGYTTLEATDGEEALHLLARTSADVAIVDFNMPRMNGPEFIKTLRGGDERLRRLSLIVYTATPENNAIRAFMETFGICDVIPKPSEPQHVLDIVSRVVFSKRNR